jgi:hypothetical protein
MDCVLVLLVLCIIVILLTQSIEKLPPSLGTVIALTAVYIGWKNNYKLRTTVPISAPTVNSSIIPFVPVFSPIESSPKSFSSIYSATDTEEVSSSLTDIFSGSEEKEERENNRITKLTSDLFGADNSKALKHTHKVAKTIDSLATQFSSAIYKDLCKNLEEDGKEKK